MRTNAPRTRSRTRVCKNQKISLHFSRVSSPHPTAKRKKKWEGNFWFCFAVTSYIISYHCDILYQYDILWIMQSESTKLGLNLKKIRTKKNISQGDIARDLGVSRGFISTIENGKTNPTLATIAKLAKAVGVSVNELLK